MRSIRRLGLCLCLLLPAQAAFAMRFAYYPGGPAGGGGRLFASGIIVPGDADRFRAVLRALPKGVRLAGVALDSPGGSLEDGLQMAAMIRDVQLPTMVDNGAKCASACFLMFAAGSHRFASTSALVGVHSASYAGLDTPDAQASTVQMARRLAEYGVPEAILGKMVIAHPSQIWWLGRAELDSMHVDTTVPQASSTPVALDLIAPTGATTAKQAIKPGFRIEPPARGYRIVPPAKGFRVWVAGSSE